MIALFLTALALAAASPPAPPPPPPTAPPPSSAPNSAPSNAPSPAPSNVPPPTPSNSPSSAPPGAPAPAPAPSGAAPNAPAAPAPPRGGEQLLDEIVAWVNDDVILWSELRDQEQTLVARILEDKKKSPSELGQAVKEVREGVLTQLISNRLLVQEAERLYNINEVKKDVVKRFKEQKQIKTDEELDRQISQWGVSRSELEDRLVMASMPDYVVDMQVLRNVSVSEAEARQYYEEHKAQFTTPARVTFREIVLMSGDADQRAARKTEAEKIVARARAGEDFEALVKELSEAPSKSLGGKIGPVSPSDLIPAIAQVAETTPVGQVSAPIETAQGWHMIKIEERQDVQTTPFESARAECEQAVRQAKSGPAYDEYLKGLWKASTIEVRRTYLDRIPTERRSLLIGRN